MQAHISSAVYVRSALFVDFDNVFITLRDQDSQLADNFAEHPEIWLDWLTQMNTRHVDEEAKIRRILLRKCYLNPQTFSRYRAEFIKSAFEVVDCPPLTAKGKTSTDIHMVMDILDALQQIPPYHEFIILSGDADFTPVLLRLRRHDVRCAVFAAGYASPAYLNASDFIIPPMEFFSGLGLSEDRTEEQPVEQKITKTVKNTVSNLAAILRQRITEIGFVPAHELPRFYKMAPEFSTSSNWLGFGTLRRLTEAVVGCDSDLVIIETDPWSVGMKRSVAQSELIIERQQATQESEVPIASVPASLLPKISQFIVQTVQKSSAPLALAALAQNLKNYFGSELNFDDWLGFGQFKVLLMNLNLEPLRLVNIGPGYLYDPSLHARPSSANVESLWSNYWRNYPDLIATAEKVHRLTNTPFIAPNQYACLLTSLAEDLNQYEFFFYQTSKRVRDRCLEKGMEIKRDWVNFILMGLNKIGYHFGANKPETPQALGAALVRNTLNLCRMMQLELEPEDITRIEKWIIGGITPAPGGPSLPPVQSDVADAVA